MIHTIIAAALVVLAATDSTVVTLRDVTVTGQGRHDYQTRSSLSGVQVGHEYLQQNFSGSLMQTLGNLPGVQAMTIGSGQSKPVIRGLGFNRLVVAEDGVKHEGQQWGDDHGLEIDQFAVDRAEVVKGPAALFYGSDAIGGVVNLFTNHIPTRPMEGAVQLLGRSNNEQLGLSARIGGRTARLFYRANMTVIDYGDYRVPTDSIEYYSYYIRLHDQRLRNTAGSERDGSVTLGYAGYSFHTDVRVSDAYSRSGFFANAHGLEVRLSGIDYDHSRRDIDLPYQWVNHLKVLSHSLWNVGNLTVEGNLAFQDNRREEHTEPVSHGYMPTPDGTLERRFAKQTYTAQVRLTVALGPAHELSMGASGEHQHNRRGGWGFIIPDFETTSAGVFLADRYTLGEHLKLNGGLRMDHARTHISSYNDWYKTPVAVGVGDSLFMQRSADQVRHFNSLTWALGVNYTVGDWVLKANVGKSFRVPIPKELGTDGVNYHIFRYERGHAGLDPEQSYQLDGGISWSAGGMALQVDPYVNYFPNYIYLTPTADYVEGLQLYHYTQARVLRWGLEAQASARLTDHWSTEWQGEYLYARQQSGEKKGYGLPFSTPWSVTGSVKYQYDWHGEGFFSLAAHVVGSQHDIVPPEKPTDGYWTLNASAGKQWATGGNCLLRLSLRAENLLNRRYYDHTSYYRLIDVPEPGRNFSVVAGLEF